MPKIMLVCSAGMSTSLMVSKMQKAAQITGENVQIFATSMANATEKLISEKPDVLLLGPQVRYLKDDFMAKTTIPINVIDMKDYGMMDGNAVLKSALQLIQNR